MIVYLQKNESDRAKSVESEAVEEYREALHMAKKGLAKPAPYVSDEYSCTERSAQEIAKRFQREHRLNSIAIATGIENAGNTSITI